MNLWEVLVPVVLLLAVLINRQIVLKGDVTAARDEARPHFEASLDEQQIVRDLKFHENELTNHRITWMVTFHSLLIAALAFAWEKRDAKTLLMGFCVAGIVVSLSSWLSLSIGGRASGRLRAWWRDHVTEGPTTPPLFAYDARRDQRFATWIILPWNFWPVFTLIGWALLLLHIERSYRDPVPLRCIGEADDHRSTSQ